MDASDLTEPAAPSPTLSIVIATRDGGATLATSVESALAGDDVEVIVVDDGSDPPVEPAALPAGTRLRVVRLEGRGVSAARNVGVAHSRGAAVAFLDDDDVLLPGWHDAVLAARQDPDAPIVCTGVRICSDDGTVVEHLPRAMGRMFDDVAGLFLAGSFVVERTLFDQVGGYDQALTFGENGELSLRLVTATKSVAVVDRPLVEIRRRVSGQRRNMASDRLVSTRHILERHADVFARHRADRARHECIVGACAAQLGDLAQARRWFGRAVRSDPLSPRAWFRFAAATVPPIGRRVWRAGS